MSEQERRELHNALASTHMEGFEVIEQTERDCIRFLSGDISVTDLVTEISPLIIATIQSAQVQQTFCVLSSKRVFIKSLTHNLTQNRKSADGDKSIRPSGFGGFS